jgi:hypothetical protein
MLSLLLITALAVQYPAAATPATDTTNVRPAVTTRATTPTPAPTAMVSRAVFHDAMRVLWEDHIFFTRNYIVSAAAGLADTPLVAERLLRNQNDIGDALNPYYGDAAANQLTGLLRNHILLAGKVIGFAKSDGQAMQDPTALNGAVAAWQANGDSIALFLSSANPRNWPRTTLQSALRMHLDMTLKEATAQLHGDWAGSIAAYDEVHQQILQMADVLSEGIMKQFPNRFNAKPTTMSSLQ